MRLYTVLLTHPQKTREFHILADSEHEARREALLEYPEPSWRIDAVIPGNLNYNPDGTLS